MVLDDLGLDRSTVGPTRRLEAEALLDQAAGDPVEFGVAARSRDAAVADATAGEHDILDRHGAAGPCGDHVAGKVGVLDSTLLPFEDHEE